MNPIVNGILRQNTLIIKSMEFSRFPKTKNPLKVGKKWYTEEVATILATGQAMLVEKILKGHGVTPYETVDEVLGDLQYLGAEILNQFNKNIGVHKASKFNIEDYMSGGRIVRKI